MRTKARPLARAYSRVYRSVGALIGATALTACAGPPPPQALKARALLARGDYDSAVRVAHRGLGVHPRSAALWRIEIRAAVAAGEAARVDRLYTRWRKLRGSNDRALARRLALATLWRGLRVPSADVRIDTIRIIERLDVEPLAKDVAARIGDEDDAVAATAAIALIHAHPQAPRVAARMLSSPDPRARAIVIAGIGRKLKEKSRPQLVAALADPSSAVRRAAVTALGNLENPTDTARLAALARRDRDPHVRAAALAALARGDRHGIEEVARAALADPYAGARLAAVKILAHRGPGALEILAHVARSADLTAAVQAAVALGRAGRARAARAALVRALASPSWPIRVAAVGVAPSALAHTAALRFAASALPDPVIEVRQAAARALRVLGQTARARQEFVAGLRAGAASVRVSAATDLARLHDPRGPAALDALASSHDAAIRARAVRALGELHRLSGAVIGALADPAAPVRLAAAAAVLGVTGSGGS